MGLGCAKPIGSCWQGRAVPWRPTPIQLLAMTGSRGCFPTGNLLGAIHELEKPYRITIAIGAFGALKGEYCCRISGDWKCRG